MKVDNTLRNMMIVSVAVGLILLFWSRLKDSSAAVFAALGILFGTLNLALGYMQAHLPEVPPTSTTPPTVP